MVDKVKKYIQLFSVFFIYSTVSVFAKLASKQDNLLKASLFMGVEILILAIYALFWQQMLKKFQLSVAISCKGITLIYAMLWSFCLFRESITTWNIVGIVLIIIGMGVVSSDG